MDDVYKNKENKLKIFSDAVDNANEAIVFLDPDLNVNYMNKSALNLLGYTKGEITKLKISDIDNDPAGLKNIDADMEKHGRWSGERFVITKNKKIIPVLLSTSFIKDEKDSISGIMGSFVDITDIKKYQRQLEARLKDLEKFQKLMIDREIRLVELKKRVRELEKKLGIEE